MIQEMESKRSHLGEKPSNFSISERGGRWYAMVFDGSEKPSTKSFSTWGRAKAWVSRCEAARLRYAPQTVDEETVQNTTLGDIVLRYGREVSSLKRGAKAEAYKIAKIAESSLGGILLNDLHSKAISQYRNDRLQIVAPSTVRIELSIIRGAIERARREWGFEIPKNHAAMVSLPPPSRGRDRRLMPGELERLEKELAGHPVALAVVRFAVHTAMRRGEILRIRWRDVNLAMRMVYLPQTKNGTPRTVPLPDGAVKVLEDLEATGECAFPIDESALRWAWVQACQKAGVRDLRFHDLRHEGVSRLFEMGLSAPEVALISGHKTIAMLMRYLHLRPIELARKLRGLKPPPPALAGDDRPKVGHAAPVRPSL